MNGDIDLANETLNLKLEVSPHSPSMIKSMFNTAFVNGTLVNPTIELNAEKVIDKALSLGMAFFMGGKQAAEELVKEQRLQNVCATALAGDQ